MAIASSTITNILTRLIHSQKWAPTTQTIHLLTIVDMRSPSGVGLTILVEGAMHCGIFSSSSRFCLIVLGCPSSWPGQPERGAMRFGKWGGLCDIINLMIPNLKNCDFLQITHSVTQTLMITWTIQDGPTTLIKLYLFLLVLRVATRGELVTGQ